MTGAGVAMGVAVGRVGAGGVAPRHARERRTRQLGVAQVGSSEVGASEVGIRQGRPVEVRTGERRALSARRLAVWRS